MALEPPGTLADQPPEFHDALLMHGRGGAVLVTPARGQQPHSQVEVISQAAGPRRSAERQQRGQPHELAIAAQADAAEMTPSALEDLGIDDEFHVLHAGEPAAVAVVDADTDLHRADQGVGEVRADRGDGVRVEPPVRVHHDDDHLVGVAVRQPAAADEKADGRVQRLSLALPRIRWLTAEQPDLIADRAPDDVSRAVVGAVIDGQDHEVAAGHGQQPLQAAEDDLLLVQARHQEDEEQAAGDRPADGLARATPCPARSAGLPGRRGSFLGSDEHQQAVAHPEDDQERGQPDQQTIRAGPRDRRPGGRKRRRRNGIGGGQPGDP